MNKREKQAAIIGGLALLAFGTAFMFTGDKDETEPENPPDGPDDPAACPPGMVRQADGSCAPIVIVDPPKPGPPPGDLDDFLNVVPQGDHFYAVKYGDIMLGSKTSTSATQGHNICWMLFRRELWEAARNAGGQNDEAAWVWVNSVTNQMSNNDKYRATKSVYDIMLCSAFNDACYGTWGYCGDKAVQLGTCSKALNVPGPHGRAIQLLKKHPNNIARIKQNKPAARYCTIGSPANAGDGRSKNKTGQKGYYPHLWCPKLDRELLWSSNGASIEVTPETWEDGSPRSIPPPWVMQGDVILDFSGTLNLPNSFGCAPGIVEFSGTPKQSSGATRG